MYNMLEVGNVIEKQKFEQSKGKQGGQFAILNRPDSQGGLIKKARFQPRF